MRDIAYEQGGFRLTTAGGEVRAAKVVLAAGNANMALAPLVGLQAPMRPNRGQIVVTERAAPFLRYPVTTVRQTDEGTVMIGDSREETNRRQRACTSPSARWRPTAPGACSRRWASST